MLGGLLEFAQILKEALAMRLNVRFVQMYRTICDCAHLSFDGLLRCAPLVLVCLYYEHVEVGDDVAQVY